MPCGYGPDNTASGNTQLYSLTRQRADRGDDAAGLGLFDQRLNVNDELNRYVDGEPRPSASTRLNQSRGYTVNATLPARSATRSPFTAYGAWGDRSSRRRSSWKPRPTTPAPRHRVLRVPSHRHDSFQRQADAHRVDRRAAAPPAELRARWEASEWPGGRRRTTRLPASYGIGGVAATPVALAILTDPASLRFDCNGNVAYGNAPGDQPGPARRTRCASATRKSFKGGQRDLPSCTIKSRTASCCPSTSMARCSKPRCVSRRPTLP